MKRTIIAAMVVVMILSIGAGAATAANSLKQGTIGLNVNVNDDFLISGKYFIMKDLAVLAGLGIGIKGGDAKGTDIGMGAGARKYLRTDDFATFVGGFLFYSSTQDSNQKALRLMGEFGAEYFLNKEFSIEGSAGFGYTSQETKTPAAPGVAATSNKETTVGTQRFGLSVNFYF